jgi:hypothetical protein
MSARSCAPGPGRCGVSSWSRFRGTSARGSRRWWSTSGGGKRAQGAGSPVPLGRVRGGAPAGAAAAARDPERRAPAQGGGGAHEGRGRPARRAGHLSAGRARAVPRALHRDEDAARPDVGGPGPLDRRAAGAGLPGRGVPGLERGPGSDRAAPERRRAGAASVPEYPSPSGGMHA